MTRRLIPFLAGAACAAAFFLATGVGAQSPARQAFMGVAKPVGPYTPGVGAGNMVFLAGQIGQDPATGALVEGGTEAEARRALDNLGAVLKDAGLSYKDVVKTTIFMTDVGEFAKVNEVYGRYFTDVKVPPARSTVQVAALPRGAHIEIEFTAMR